MFTSRGTRPVDWPMALLRERAPGLQRRRHATRAFGDDEPRRWFVRVDGRERHGFPRSVNTSRERRQNPRVLKTQCSKPINARLPHLTAHVPEGVGIAGYSAEHGLPLTGAHHDDVFYQGELDAAIMTFSECTGEMRGRGSGRDRARYGTARTGASSHRRLRRPARSGGGGIHPAGRRVLRFRPPDGAADVASLPFVPDQDDPGAIVAAYRDATAPGSHPAGSAGAARCRAVDAEYALVPGHLALGVPVSVTSTAETAGAGRRHSRASP